MSYGRDDFEYFEKVIMPRCRFYIRGVFWKCMDVPDVKILTDGPTTFPFKLHMPDLTMKEFKFTNSVKNKTGFNCTDGKQAFELMESRKNGN